jgi:hypothetical protein
LRKLLPILALMVMFAGLLPSSGAAQPVSTSPDYGASVFAFGHPETTGRDLQLMAAAGLRWARFDIPWRSVEASCRNCFDWSDLDRAVAAAGAVGLKIMARVDRPPEWARPVIGPFDNGPPDDPEAYADFVQQIARRYAPGSPRGTIHAIAVWNEPNLNREWGGGIIDRNQASQYMYLLKLTYQYIKQMSPGTLVVSAGLSPTGTNDGTAQPDDVYLGWLYEEGLAQWADVIGMHGAGFGSPPDAVPGSNPVLPGPWNYFRRVEQLQGIKAAYGDAAKPVWLLEFGWPANEANVDGVPVANPHPEYNFYAVTPQQQANYIVQAYQYAQTNWSGWIGVMFIWNIADPTWTPAHEQFFWSITNPSGSTRLAYDRLAAARASGELP